MRHTHVTFAKRVGVAPGTTTLRLDGGLGDAPFVNQPSQTQAVWEPDPNSDNVRIAVPPTQWVTGPTEMRISMPVVQKTMGPVPNDLDISQTRPGGYLPVHRGWIDTETGEPIFTLQGGGGELGQDSPALKWSIAASVLSAIALTTTTILAVMRYKKGR